MWHLPLPPIISADPQWTTQQHSWEQQMLSAHQMFTVGYPCAPCGLLPSSMLPCFFPRHPLQAMKRGYLPSLRETNLKRHPPPAEATTMGHMDNKRKHTQSEDSPKGRGIRRCILDQLEDVTRSSYFRLTTAYPRHIVYTDQTSRLPHTSVGGNLLPSSAFPTTPSPHRGRRQPA
jgi:hypothetical protein